LPVAEISRKDNISNVTCYLWKSKYSGVSASELKRIKDLEVENSKLKRMYAEKALENTAVKVVLPRFGTSNLVNIEQGISNQLRLFILICGIIDLKL
jgi:putative transposase